MKSIRPILPVVGVLLVLVALWQFAKFAREGTDQGFNNIVIAIVCMVVAMACGFVWMLTKPKESMEDISITKF